MVAARTAELDRTAFAAAIGDRGVWFVEQNPQWARLAKDLRSPPPDEAAPQHRVAAVEVTEDAVRADPELIMRRRDALVEATQLGRSWRSSAAAGCSSVAVRYADGRRSTTASPALRARAVRAADTDRAAFRPRGSARLGAYGLAPL